jgi:hypothetical protein
MSKGGQMKQILRYSAIALLGYCVIGLLGCAGIKEGIRGFWGISTKVLEDGRKDAVKKQFNYDFDACFKKVKETLKRNGSYIYAEDLNKKMIAIYLSEEDTTPVGIFFEEIDANNTQIEVSSPSTYAKESIAKVLEDSLKQEEKKG